MTSNRIAFVFAIGLAVLASFMLNGSEAEPGLSNPTILPEETRVDASQLMNFAVDFDSDGDETTALSVEVWFDGVATPIELTCTTCESGSKDGTYTILESTPEAGTLVTSIGDGKISYGFRANWDESDDGAHWPAPGDTCLVGTDNCDVRVNTVPVLTDNAAVAGGGMPEDTYSLTITYTDADGHSGIFTTSVCDESDVCESLALSKQSGTDEDGAVYGTDFTTELGGTLTVTVEATDNYDDAADTRTTTFTVDTETPWLKNAGVSATSAGEDESITFTVTYCVFDAGTTGTPTVEVTVGAAAAAAMSAGESNDDCKNGIDYSLATTVGWADSAQTVIFSASNDLQSGSSVTGDSVSINDAPVFVADSGIAERADNGEDFSFQVDASDANSDDGDSFKAYVTVEGDDELEMFCQVDGTCTATIPEVDIIDQMGGVRAVSFRLQDDNWNAETPDDFGLTIEVTRTSSFDWTAPSNGNFQPGSNDYDFTITNNGNSEDTFTVTAASDNGWVASGSESQTVTVGKDATETFTITMDVSHVAAGIVDHWSASVVAGNDDTKTNSHEGETTVDSVSGVSVMIGTNSGSALPGDSVSYSFVITNTGNADEAFAYTTSSASTWGIGSGDGTTSSLAMGASETITVVHTVSESASSGISDTITFDAGGGFPDGASRTATTTAEQTYGVSITLGTSTLPSTLNPGDSFTTSYTVTNTGNGADTFTVFFDASWMSGSSGTTLNLAEGESDSSVLTMTVPADAASSSSSTASASVAGGGGVTASYGPQTITVADSTRSASVSTDSDSYGHNAGSSATGTVTILNTGVGATFAVSATDGELSFESSTITLAEGATGSMAFTVAASSSGDVTFTIVDVIDGSVASGSFSVTVNTFNTVLLTTDTSDCGSAAYSCVTDDAGGFASGVYTNAGTWYTTMTATDSNGMTGTHTFTTTIANAEPTVSALNAPAGTIAQTAQDFSFSVPEDTDGTITQFVIDFGDGNSVTLDSDDLDGRNAVAVKHNYTMPGEYTITATAYDNSGGNTVQTTTIEVGDRTVTMGDNSYLYNLVALVGFFLLGSILTVTSFRMTQGVIAGDEEMNERDRQRLESVERRMESLSEREELLEVSAYDASRAATKLEEHISAFNEILVKAQEIAAEEKLKELEAAEESKAKEEEQMQLDLEDPDIEMVAERFHEALGRLVNARGELSKIEEQLAHILKMERDEQLEKLTEMTESYETTKRKIDALQSSAEARDAAAVENNIMNLLSAAASGGSVGGADFGDFGDFGDDDDEFEVEIYEDEDGSFYYIDPDTGEEVPCDEEGNAL